MNRERDVYIRPTRVPAVPSSPFAGLSDTSDVPPGTTAGTTPLADAPLGEPPSAETSRWGRRGRRGRAAACPMSAHSGGPIRPRERRAEDCPRRSAGRLRITGAHVSLARAKPDLRPGGPTARSQPSRSVSALAQTAGRESAAHKTWRVRRSSSRRASSARSPRTADGAPPRRSPRTLGKSRTALRS